MTFGQCKKFQNRSIIDQVVNVWKLRAYFVSLYGPRGTLYLSTGWRLQWRGLCRSSLMYRIYSIQSTNLISKSILRPRQRRGTHARRHARTAGGLASLYSATAPPRRWSVCKLAVGAINLFLVWHACSAAPLRRLLLTSPRTIPASSCWCWWLRCYDANALYSCRRQSAGQAAWSHNACHWSNLCTFIIDGQHSRV